MIVKNKKFLFVGLTIISMLSIVTFNIIFARAEANSDVRDEVLKINDEIMKKKTNLIELNRQIDTLKNSINNKKREVSNLENQVYIINNRVKTVNLEISAAETEIETKKLEIETLEIEARERQQEMEQKKKLVGELLRRLYKASSASYLEILLINDNFSDFFREITMLEGLEKNLGDEVTRLKELRDAIEKRQLIIENDERSLQTAKEALSEKKIVLSETKAAKQILAEEALQVARGLAINLQEVLKQKDAIDNEVFRLQARIQEKLNTSDKFSFTGNIILSWPVPNQGITTYFYDRDYPFRHVFEHTGLDIRTLVGGRPSNGLAVKAAAPGIVIKTVYESIYGGNIIYIAHAGSITTVYMHLSRILINVGDEVARGDLIGYSGGMPGTPGAGRFTTGPHLHFEVRKDGVPVDPLDYLINF